MSLAGKKSFAGILFVSPLIIGLLTVFGIPLVKSFLFSISEIKSTSNGYTIDFKGFGNYKYIFFDDSEFLPIFFSTIKDVIWRVPLVVVFSFFVSTLLNQQFKGRMFARALFFLPVLVSSGVILKVENLQDMESYLFHSGTVGTELSNMLGGIHLEEYLLKLGIADSLIQYFSRALSEVYVIINASGVQILLLISALQTIPEALYEASSIEGATAWENFWKITFPMVSPYILVVAIYSIIDSFMRIDGTLNMSTYIDLVVQKLEYGRAASMAWIYFTAIGLFLAIVFFIVSRFVQYND